MVACQVRRLAVRGFIKAVARPHWPSNWPQTAHPWRRGTKGIARTQRLHHQCITYHGGKHKPLRKEGNTRGRRERPAVITQRVALALARHLFEETLQRPRDGAKALDNCQVTSVELSRSERDSYS